MTLQGQNSTGPDGVEEFQALWLKPSREFLVGAATDSVRRSIRRMIEFRTSPATTESTWERYWDWFAVALFLLLTVDLLMTMGATIVYGLDAEANPLMRWVLAQGLLTIVVTHLLVLLLAVAGFGLLIRHGQSLQGRRERRFRLSTELWLGLLVAGGLLVYANNLAVIVLGGSLL